MDNFGKEKKPKPRGLCATSLPWQTVPIWAKKLHKAMIIPYIRDKIVCYWQKERIEWSFISKSGPPLQKNALCQICLNLAQWFSRSFKNFVNIFSLNLVIASSLKTIWPFSWTLKPLWIPSIKGCFVLSFLVCFCHWDISKFLAHSRCTWNRSGPVSCIIKFQITNSTDIFRVTNHYSTLFSAFQITSLRDTSKIGNQYVFVLKETYC